MSLKSLYIQTLIVFSLVLISFGVEAKAQSIILSIPTNNSAPTGSTVEIPVNITYTYPPATEPPVDPNRIVAFNFVVVFDQNVIIPNTATDMNGDPIVIVQTGTASSSFACAIDTNTTGTGRLGIACSTSGNGYRPVTSGTEQVLVKLVFQVIGTANSPTGTTALTLSTAPGELRFENRNGVLIPTTTSNGTFTVTGATAASITVSGRVLTANGRGLRGAQVRLTTADGTTRTVMSSALGYYRFADVPAGQTATVQIISKRYGFEPRIVNLSGDVTDVNFIAEP